jgi:hypothetical protein
MSNCFSTYLEAGVFVRYFVSFLQGSGAIGRSGKIQLSAVLSTSVRGGGEKVEAEQSSGSGKRLVQATVPGRGR